jgi:hypothetical protein
LAFGLLVRGQFFGEDRFELCRLGMAMSGGQSNPFIAFDQVLRNAVTVGVTKAKGKLGFGFLLVGGLAVPTGGFDDVIGQALPGS